MCRCRTVCVCVCLSAPPDANVCRIRLMWAHVMHIRAGCVIQMCVSVSAAPSASGSNGVRRRGARRTMAMAAAMAAATTGRLGPPTRTPRPSRNPIPNRSPSPPPSGACAARCARPPAAASAALPRPLPPPLCRSPEPRERTAQATGARHRTQNGLPPFLFPFP